jgi:hypothetical protein
MADTYEVLQTDGTVEEFRAEQLEEITETVVPPQEAPDVVIYVLGRLKPGEEGRQVV